MGTIQAAQLPTNLTAPLRRGAGGLFVTAQAAWMSELTSRVHNVSVPGGDASLRCCPLRKGTQDSGGVRTRRSREAAE